MAYNTKNVTVRLMTKVFQEKNTELASKGNLSVEEVEKKMKDMTPTIFWMMESVYDALVEQNYLKND
jgi:hypothetical protein